MSLVSKKCDKNLIDINHKNITARKFSQSAKQYAEHAQVQHISSEYLLSLIPQKQHGICLDLGAGPGVNINVLKSKFDQVIALDLSLDMLKQIKTHNVSSVCADMDALPFKSGSLECVFSNFATQWSQNLPRLLHHIYQLLKAEGVFYLSIVCDGTLKEIEQAWRGIDNNSHINQFINKNDLMTLVEQSGFNLVHNSHTCLQQKFDSPLKALKSIKVIGASHHGQKNKGLLGKSTLKNVLAAYPKVKNEYCVSYQVAYLTLKK
ncbi:methyltransferase domain-containing protein [Pseudoalteromonas denitrificans]|uniref:Malonyl-CoA O-methyltransferase n=1 Tax=Pseudoalteromonas denitrificans DSM 6059 TaxID=1123010 RepID=A0A1I1SKG3_9GAMM|nr:methyltransferase domain-containing protein [Pseudoalteromonas denitrificans]SFD46975.1 malonyl-CoA O-methyltransferase [Pseudoalteromonas denitrificans DSM 6059]